ncbi:uncharacterized protein [Elaeis guineensis]|uniref:uncharacterized protein isoform X2 n=1 Tax=Elaeis guineensis var. tenera TaxID=51953 RepID=UPI003C6CCFAF
MHKELLFGFRNPFVQRLLREVVANVNGAAERNLLSPISNNRASKFDHAIQIQDGHTYPDLLLYLEKQRSTRKRSTKCKNPTKSLQKEARAKRICCDTGGGPSKQLCGFCSHATIYGTKYCQEEHFSLCKSKCPTIQDTPNHFTYTQKGSALNDETLEPADTEGEGNGRNIGFATSVNNCSKNEDPGNSLLREPPVVEGDCIPFLGEGEQLAEVGNSDCIVEKHVISCEENKLEDCKDSRFTCGDNPPCNAENMVLDRSVDAQLEQRDSKDRSVDVQLEQRYSEDDDGEIPVLEMSANVCVPDTCDAAKECCKGSPCSMKSEPAGTKLLLGTSTSYNLEVISRSMPYISKHSSSKCVHPMQEEVLHHVKSSPDDALSKGMVKDSLPEVGSSSGSSGPGSEKNDLDLVGQELARSMMAFLLPQAVPLLKKTYVRTRSRHRNQEVKIDPSTILSRANSAEQKLEGDCLTANECQGNVGAGMLLQESEEDIPERRNDLHTSLNVNFQDKMTKVEHLVTACMIDERLTNCGSSKDIKSIIPDSFEDDQYGYDTSSKRPSPSGFDEADDVPSDETKQNIDASESFFNEVGGVREPSDCLIGNSECDGGPMLSNELKKGENLLSDSLVAFLEEEVNDECMNGGERISSPGPCLNVNCTDDMMSLDPDFVKHDNSQHFISESMYKSEKEILISECMPQHISFGNDEANHFKQDPPASTPEFNNLGEKGIPEILECSEKGLNNSSQHDLVNFGVCSTVKSRDANIRKQAGWLSGQAVISGKGDTSICMTDAELPTNELPHDSGKAGKLPHSPHSTRKCNIPLSESIICRNYDSNSLEACFAPNTSGTVEDGQARPTKNNPNTSMLFANEIKIDEHLHITNKMENTNTSVATLPTACPVFSQIQDGVRNAIGYTKFSNFSDPSLSCSSKNHADSVSKLHSSKEFCIPQVQNVLEHSRNDVLRAFSCSNKSPPTELTINADCQVLLNDHLCQRNNFDTKSKKEFRDLMKLVGCYLHPNPVLSIFLITKEDFLQICVLCGILEDNERYLFIYTVPIQEQSESCPSFIGYTSLVFPLFKGPSNAKMPFERSQLQFTPDGQFLVFLNSIRAPHCREQNTSCLCSMCRFGCSEENAVKVVQVKFGYVSPVIKLTTVERLSCLLVCEPNYLITVEESGRLYVWIMNSTWSGKLEEFMLPSFDHIAPKVLELKRIPKHDFLIVGHNGIGGFGLWDISRRVLLAKFSAPGHMISQILPVGLFSFPNKGGLTTSLDLKEHMKENANSWVTDAVEDPFLLTSGENVAVWVLISSVSDLEARHHHLVKEPCTSSAGWWRLALLASNMVVVGSVLDPRASALDASADYGIIGTSEGLLYKWELSTGKKVATMHSFKCGSVSCIAVDAQSGVVAVAGDKRQLLVYTQQRGELQS